MISTNSSVQSEIPNIGFLFQRFFFPLVNPPKTPKWVTCYLRHHPPENGWALSPPCGFKPYPVIITPSQTIPTPLSL